MNRIAASLTPTPVQPFFVLPPTTEGASTVLHDTADVVWDVDSSVSSDLVHTAAAPSRDAAPCPSTSPTCEHQVGGLLTPRRTPQSNRLALSESVPLSSRLVDGDRDCVEELSDTELSAPSRDHGSWGVHSASRPSALSQKAALHEVRRAGRVSVPLRYPKPVARLPSPSAVATAVLSSPASQQGTSVTTPGSDLPRNVLRVSRLRRRLDHESTERLRRYHVLSYSVRQRLFRCYYDMWQRAASRSHSLMCSAGTQTQRAPDTQLWCQSHSDAAPLRGGAVAFGSNCPTDAAVGQWDGACVTPSSHPSRRFEWSALSRAATAPEAVAATSLPYRLLDYATHSDTPPRKECSASSSPAPAVALPAVVPHPMRIVRV